MMVTTWKHAKMSTHAISPEKSTSSLSPPRNKCGLIPARCNVTRRSAINNPMCKTLRLCDFGSRRESEKEEFTAADRRGDRVRARKQAFETEASPSNPPPPTQMLSSLSIHPKSREATVEFKSFLWI